MKQKRHLAQILPIAEAVLAEIAPYCRRQIIAGSIRRREAEVGDIEIVAIPRREPAGLFGDQEDVPLHRALSDLVKGNRIFLVAHGDKYIKFVWYFGAENVQVDLFLVEPDSWGYQLAIRTGPADYSRWLVTPQSKHGGLSEGYLCKDGMVWDVQVNGNEWAATTHAVPEEKDFFKLIRGGYIEPWLRRPCPM